MTENMQSRDGFGDQVDSQSRRINRKEEKNRRMRDGHLLPRAVFAEQLRQEGLPPDFVPWRDRPIDGFRGGPIQHDETLDLHRGLGREATGVIIREKEEHEQEQEQEHEQEQEKTEEEKVTENVVEITVTCGSCYGAHENEGDCCNTCDDLLAAYKKKGWNQKDIQQKAEQCIVPARPQNL